MSNSDVKWSIGLDMASGPDKSVVSIMYGGDGHTVASFLTYDEYLVLREKTEGCLWIIEEDERKVEHEKGNSGT